MRRSRASAMIVALMVVVGACGEVGTMTTAGTATTVAEVTTTGAEATTTTTTEPAQVEELIVGFPVVNPQLWSGFEIALELGYYAQEGVNPEFQFLAGGSEVARSLLSGQIDIGPAPVGNAVEAVSEGFTDLRAVFPVVYGTIITIVALKDSGIETVEDLEGKTVGVTDLAGGELPVMRGMMRSVGLPDDQFVPVGDSTPLIARALSEGTIDAMGGFLSDFAPLEAQGIELNYISPPELEAVPATVVLTTAQLLDGNPDLVAAFLRATAKGYEFAHANPEGAVALLKKVHPDQFTDEVGEAIFHLNRPLTNPPDGIYGSGNTLQAWNTFFEFIQVELPEGVDLAEIVNDDLVDLINDFDREAVAEEANNYSG